MNKTIHHIRNWTVIHSHDHVHLHGVGEGTVISATVATCALVVIIVIIVAVCVVSSAYFYRCILMGTGGSSIGPYLTGKS